MIKTYWETEVMLPNMPETECLYFDSKKKHLVKQVCQSFCHAVASHVETDQSQVSAVCVQVVQTLLVEAAVWSLTLWSIHRTGLVQGVLQLP